MPKCCDVVGEGTSACVPLRVEAQVDEKLAPALIPTRTLAEARFRQDDRLLDGRGRTLDA